MWIQVRWAQPNMGKFSSLKDGAETDLDLGHYERFIRTKMTKRNNFTTGKNLFWSIT